MDCILYWIVLNDMTPPASRSAQK